MRWLRWWRWYLIGAALFALAATTTGHNVVEGFFPAAMAVPLWALRAHVMFDDPQPPPITDDDIWAWISGHR